MRHDARFLRRARRAAHAARPCALQHGRPDADRALDCERRLRQVDAPAHHAPYADFDACRPMMPRAPHRRGRGGGYALLSATMMIIYAGRRRWRQ